MTNKEFVLDTLRAQGKSTALAIQAKAATMTATELVAVEGFLPLFSVAIENQNMLDRPVGFAVKTALGNVCKLLNVYDSETYPDEPEDYPSMWGFQWSQDPGKAKPFISLATSPYMTGDCCLWEGTVKRSTIDNNIHSPEAYPEGWENAESEDDP